MKPIRLLAALPAAFALLLGAAGAALSVVGPVAENDAYSVAEDGALDVPAPGVLDNDGTPATGNVLCVGSVDTSNLHGTLDWNPDGSFVYTPTANYNGMGAGNSFTYTMHEVVTNAACTGDAGTLATVEITVTPENDAPTAAGDSFSVVKNVTLNVAAPGVLRNDQDIDGDTLSAVKVSNPSHGVVILAADGSFAYTPSAGYVGPDAFSYKASDGSATSLPRVVSLTVTAIPPIATPTPTPTPIPTPTLTPIQTPQETIAEPSPTLEASPSLEPSPSPGETFAPSASPAPSPSPGSSAAPAPVDGGGGVSLPVLLVIVLFVLLAGFGAALYVPKWLAAQRGEPPDLD